jgi:hypothetical protein
LSNRTFNAMLYEQKVYQQVSKQRIQETKAASIGPGSLEELVSPAEMVYRSSDRASRNPGAPAEMTIGP